MRLAVTLLGLDLLTIEVTTEAASDGPGDAVSTSTEVSNVVGFCLPSMEYEES